MSAIVENIQSIINLGFAGALCFALLAGWRKQWVWGYQYKAKEEECEEERNRADAADQKYVELLKEEIKDHKERDRTLDTITALAARGKVE